jgi:archaellum biogenesis protein FlaJ (TadC family)
MLTWFHGNEEVMWWMLAASVFAFFSTLLLVPLVLIRLPSDYFSYRRRRETRVRTRHPVVLVFFGVLKNFLALLFILAGIAMLVLPGQGILTIVVGLMLLDFPGKYRVERWAVGHGSVLQAINWIRTRAHKPPLMVELDESPDPSRSTTR